MNKKKSIVTSWVYSYILILLIPILTIFINYYYNNKVIENQIIHANKLVLHNLQQSVDSSLYNEAYLYTSILTSAEFFSLISHEDMSNEFYADTIEIKRLHAFLLNRMACASNRPSACLSCAASAYGSALCH